MTAGYSVTPLARKLGLKPGMHAWFHEMPESVRAEITRDVAVAEQPVASAGIEAAHLFVTERAELERLLLLLHPLMAPSGQIWVSWPKKAAKVPTDIVEDAIRAVALPMGLVDIKVCAVDAVWSQAGDAAREPLGSAGIRRGLHMAIVTKRILAATAIAGTLDILAAMVLTVTNGGTVAGMLRSVASGPFSGAREWGGIGAALGLATHFVLMAAMAAVFVLAADRIAALKRQPVLWGALYGVGLWVVMYFLVLPTRFGAPLPHDPKAVAIQLFCHIALVGIPIALVARRG